MAPATPRLKILSGALTPDFVMPCASFICCLCCAAAAVHSLPLTSATLHSSGPWATFFP